VPANERAEKDAQKHRSVHPCQIVGGRAPLVVERLGQVEADEHLHTLAHPQQTHGRDGKVLAAPDADAHERIVKVNGHLRVTPLRGRRGGVLVVIFVRHTGFCPTPALGARLRLRTPQPGAAASTQVSPETPIPHFFQKKKV